MTNDLEGGIRVRRFNVGDLVKISSMPFSTFRRFNSKIIDREDGGVTFQVTQVYPDFCEVTDPSSGRMHPVCNCDLIDV